MSLLVDGISLISSHKPLNTGKGWRRRHSGEMGRMGVGGRLLMTSAKVDFISELNLKSEKAGRGGKRDTVMVSKSGVMLGSSS